MPGHRDRLPFVSTQGRTTLHRRFMACADRIAEQVGVQPDDVRMARLLGSGNYGCVYLIDALPPDRNILKITADNLEAHTVALLRSWGEAKPDAIVKFAGVWRLGNCSVLPRMREFRYRQPGQVFGGGYFPGHQVYYRGPGAPYRPVWLIQREELPDAWPVLRAQGVRIRELRDALQHLLFWAQHRSVDWGIEASSYWRTYSRPDGDYLRRALKFVQGEALLEALDWLMERGILFMDFTKIVNLGWRESTGLVIRDIGFASTAQELEDEDEPRVINPVEVW